jgi:hypothetical protein
MTSIAVGNRRLLRLAKILDTADALHRKRKEPTYCQLDIEHWEPVDKRDPYGPLCGTPACALGHYGANADRGAKARGWGWSKTKGLITASFEPFDDARAEFAVTEAEADELFEVDGCGKAQTAKQAAKYIRAFVKRRSKK